MLTLEPPPAPTPRLRRVDPPARTPLRRLRRLCTEGRRWLLRRLGSGLCALRAAWLWLLAAPRLRRLAARGPLRLSLGSGDAPLPGWVNIDLGGDCDVRLDLTARLPLPAGSVRCVHSEHLIEHLDRADGLRLLRECRRVLAADGVLRIATPDLAALVESYRGDWRDQDWVRWPGHRWIDSAACMLNQAFRGWGHRHLYDEAELTAALRAAGFADVRRQAIGASAHPDLAGLETRPDSKLVLEARGRLETIA